MAYQYVIPTWNNVLPNAWRPVMEVIQLATTEQQVDIDLGACSFISPVTLLALTALGARKDSWAEKILYRPAEGPIASFVHQLCFPNGYDLTQVDENTLKDYCAGFQAHTFHPIIRLHLSSGPQQQTTLVFLEKYQGLLIRQQLTHLGISSDLYETIAYTLEEMTQNMLQHSRCDVGMVVLQQYPDHGFIDIAFADTGKGFTHSYQFGPRPYPEVVDDVTAIRAALDQKSTKDQAVSMGFGLKSTRKALCIGLRGQFFLWSGQGFYYNKGGDEQFGQLPVSYPGSLVVARVPTSIPVGYKLSDYLE